MARSSARTHIGRLSNADSVGGRGEWIGRWLPMTDMGESAYVEQSFLPAEGRTSQAPFVPCRGQGWKSFLHRVSRAGPFRPIPAQITHFLLTAISPATTAQDNGGGPETAYALPLRHTVAALIKRGPLVLSPSREALIGCERGIAAQTKSSQANPQSFRETLP
jgi:hypothetical protein